MRRFIKLLSPLLLAALFISCAQSVKQNSSISFDGGKIISRAVQYSINKSRGPEAGGYDEEEFTTEMEEAVKAALEFKATLSMEINSEDKSYHKTAEEDYDIDYSSAAVLEKKNIKFEDVPVGIKAIIDAKITSKIEIKDDDAFASLLELWGMPPEELTNFSKDDILEMLANEVHWNFVFYGKSELTVHEGENSVTMKMSSDPNGGGSGQGGEGEEGDEGIAIGGTIEPKIPQTLTIKINESASDSKVFLNKGTLAFKLLDAEGNEVTADPENPDLGNAIWTYKLSLKNTEIPDSVSSASGDVVYYEAETSEGKIEIKNLPAAGTYQLYVQVQPTATGYTDCATTSAMFELEINTTYFSFSINSNDENYINFSSETNIPRTKLLSTETDVYLELYGETTSFISGIIEDLHDFLNNSFSSKPYFFSIDISKLTTSSTGINAAWLTNWDLRYLGMLQSIIMPDCVTQYYKAVFQQCVNLKYVKFGEAANDLSIMKSDENSYNVFSECSNLEKVEFAKTDGWYNSSETINVSSVDWSTLEALDVSDPEVNAKHIKNGDWAYLYRKTE